MEYVVDREPVKGVSVRVSVYGEAGIPDASVEAEPLTAGSVENRMPVESPMTDDGGQ
jgi:hypothetical protein